MYTFAGRIRYSETDAEETLTIPALMNYLQDCSTFQSEDGNVGIRYLADHNWGWIVNFWQIDILRLPKLGEEVVTGTSPYSLKGFMGLRNFMMETKEGERLVNVNSVWSLLDLQGLKPVRVPEEMYGVYTLNEPFDMEYSPRKVVLPKEEPERFDGIRVMPYMMDSNHHLNNARYLSLLSDLLGDGRTIRRLRIEYKKQAVVGDLMIPALYRGEQETAAFLDEEGAAYCALEIYRRNRTDEGP